MSFEFNPRDEELIDREEYEKWEASQKTTMPNATLPLLSMTTACDVEIPLFTCRSGQHQWRTREDAHCCCNPAYRRMQRVHKALTGFGVEYGDFYWVVQPLEPKRKPR